MKAFVILTLAFTFTGIASARTDIDFNSMINSGFKKQKSLVINTKALAEGVEHNTEEGEILNFVANEVKLNKASKVVYKNKRARLKSY